MIYNILCNIDVNRVYYLMKYPSGRQFTWSEATFLNHYYDGESFYKLGQVLNQSEIPRTAISETVQWNSDYGCWRFLVRMNVKDIVNKRQKYVFVRESAYNHQAEFYVNKGVSTSSMFEAKVFDESNVYSQMRLFEKMKAGYRVQRIQ